ncbi:auxin-responsive protein SAUR68-like [Impatiens glandulifera]|uniref:auxin-responsive protein SAUR68-like n=1 Tax=Impatiens glandulifera TaxID=253017 RepID=UPI001FB0CDAC|nr:auxin-responsive protein SAUR68-like [Impatiens glandulifera]
MAKKWQRMALNGSKRISFPAKIDDERREVVIADKGNFVVYSIDKRRFQIPLKYLECNILKEMLKISEDEFGLPGDGPIVLPWDAASVNLTINLISRNNAINKEIVLDRSILLLCCSSSRANEPRLVRQLEQGVLVVCA